MPFLQELARKSNTKSRLSSGHKSKVSKQSINHKQKIVNVIQKSPLSTKKPTKSNAYSKTKHPNTQKKKKSNPYQAQSQRHRQSKNLSTISRSIPVKSTKQKTIQFPFDAIKFKQNLPVHHQIKQSQTHQGFFIRYDQPEIFEMNMSVLNNSKKIVGSYNQRVGRYSQLKTKQKVDFGNEIKNAEFKEALIKLFRFLDPHCTETISHAQIDYKKVPQAVLYFLGGLFHRIRQRNICLSQKDFLEEGNMIYSRSSSQDVKWFIEEVKALPWTTQSNSKIQSQQKVVSHPSYKKIPQNSCQVQKVEQKYEIPSFQKIKQKLPITNLSFGQDQSISFRKQAKEHQNQTRCSYPSERQSIKSAQFGYDAGNRFSFDYNDKKMFQVDLKQQNSVPLSRLDPSKSAMNQQNCLGLQKLNENQIQAMRTGGIKRNGGDKVDDFRQQIYAKLDKMKINTDNKQNQLIKDSFKPSTFINNKNEHTYAIGNSRKTDNDTTIAREFQPPRNRIPTNQTLHLVEKQLSQTIQTYQNSQSSKIKQKIQPDHAKDPGWVNKIKNCQKAFDELQKIKNQFKLHKNTIEQRQFERENYFKDQIKPSISSSSDFVLEQQTRVLKLTERRPIQERQNTLYQRNIDRLANLGISNNQNSHPINLNETLSNSCRKSIEISLPLKCDTQKGVSLSEKKGMRSQKIDKIDQLSLRLEKYLKSNAQKIQYSKIITESSGGVGFNRLLAH